jgi:hypothetical protein
MDRGDALNNILFFVRDQATFNITDRCVIDLDILLDAGISDYFYMAKIAVNFNNGMWLQDSGGHVSGAWEVLGVEIPLPTLTPTPSPTPTLTPTGPTPTHTPWPTICPEGENCQTGSGGSNE